MNTDQIVKLSPESIQELLSSRVPESNGRRQSGQRRAERWPFPGAVEVWLPSGSYGQQHILGTMHNLSALGLAMRCDRPISSDTRISLAIHEPEMSLYGEGVVRHCTRANTGYLIGVEFSFTPDQEDAQTPEETES